MLANNLGQYENFNKHWKNLHYIFLIKEYNNLEANVSTLKYIYFKASHFKCDI